VAPERPYQPTDDYYTGCACHGPGPG